MNRLIAFEFNPSEQLEIVDYQISFLKMISLSLAERPHLLQFFYNERFKDFPLYGAAIKLYNYPEPMVRTAVRTITLNVYNLTSKDPELCNVLLGLPHAVYFPNLSCQLKSRWKKVDELLAKEKVDIDDMRDEIDDISELMMYF